MEQGDLGLLEEPAAQQLLRSSNPARLAYIWRDGSPRVVARWFDWSDGRLVMASPWRAPKFRALTDGARVAVTIDDAGSFPYRELMIRGAARVERVDQAPEAYERAARRYFGAEQGDAWVDTVRAMPWASITIVPDWVGLLDFETRFPSALSA